MAVGPTRERMSVRSAEMAGTAAAAAAAAVTAAAAAEEEEGAGEEG